MIIFVFQIVNINDNVYLEAMASVRRGSLVILCMGSIRNECMARP